MRTASRSARLASVMALSCLFVTSLQAQIGGIRRGLQRAAGAVPNPAAMLQGDPPITTSLGDARFEVDSLDNFNPSAFTQLQSLERGPNGGFMVRAAGAYSMWTQSYCLKAGTHGPGAGDGYLYAPPMGPAEDAVVTIIRNSVRHPDIPQRNVQYLLWAIIARAKFEDLPMQQKQTAAQLLSPEQLARLNRSALDLLPDGVMQEALNSIPEPAKTIVRAEADLRRMMTSANSTFEDIERAAVLVGAAPRGAGSREVPTTRWSRHPDGFFVRFEPTGYSRTRMEVWVPEGAAIIGRELDPSRIIAVPTNTARQRLIQSGRPHPNQS